MPSIRLEDLTPFGRLALKLDNEFAELTRVAGQISHLNIESDSGLDEGVKILKRVAEYGQSIAETMQEFSKSLEETRDKAEAATKIAAERAQLIQQRRQQADQLEEKLTKVKEAVRDFGAGLAGVSAPEKRDLSNEDKRRIAAELERMQTPIAGFIEAAQAIKAEAARSNFKRLERQAHSMIDSLQATRRKITQAIAPKQDERR